MKNIIIGIVSFLIIIGTIGVAMNLSMGNQTIVYLTKIRMDNGMFVYKFNWNEYIKNLNLYITDTSKLMLQLPARQWQTLTASNFGTALGNNLALMLDYVILIINVMIYPFRVGAYALRTLLALIGVNSDTNNAYNGLGWLIELVDWFVERIQIPYIPE